MWTRHIGMSRSQHQLSHWTVTMIKWYENDYIWCLGSTNYFFDDFSWMNSTMWFLYLRNFSYVLFSLKWKSNCWVTSGFERLLISDLSQHWWFIKILFSQQCHQPSKSVKYFFSSLDSQHLSKAFVTRGTNWIIKMSILKSKIRKVGIEFKELLKFGNF